MLKNGQVIFLVTVALLDHTMVSKGSEIIELDPGLVDAELDPKLDSTISEIAILFRYPKLLDLDEKTNVAKFYADLQVISNRKIFKESFHLKILNNYPKELAIQENGNQEFQIPCKTNFAKFPWDSASCTFEIALNGYNTSQIKILPIFMPGDLEFMGTSIWGSFETLASTQLFVEKDQQYELALFTSNFSRKSISKYSILIWIFFFLNSTAIFSNNLSTPIFIAEILLIFYVFLTSTSPLNLLEIILLCYFSLLVLFSVFQNILPSILIGFRCSPRNSHPDPPKYPPPIDQISLDSERRSLVDSARSLREVYASEIRITLHSLNEMIEHKSIADYQSRNFKQKLSQINGIFASIFLFFNFGVLLFGICR